jgi:hypothetical protein
MLRRIIGKLRQTSWRSAARSEQYRQAAGAYVTLPSILAAIPQCRHILHRQLHSKHALAIPQAIALKAGQPLRIESWDDHDIPVEQLIALVADHAVARAAFVEAVRRRPGKIIVLRQKSRVLADSRR